MVESGFPAVGSKILSAISIARGPLSLTMPIPLLPGGVETAQIVESSFIELPKSPRPLKSDRGIRKPEEMGSPAASSSASKNHTPRTDNFGSGA